jgi:hypothetical protein
MSVSLCWVGRGEQAFKACRWGVPRGPSQCCVRSLYMTCGGGGHRTFTPTPGYNHHQHVPVRTFLHKGGTQEGWAPINKKPPTSPAPFLYNSCCACIQTDIRRAIRWGRGGIAFPPCHSHHQHVQSRASHLVNYEFTMSIKRLLRGRSKRQIPIEFKR